MSGYWREKLTRPAADRGLKISSLLGVYSGWKPLQDFQSISFANRGVNVRLNYGSGILSIIPIALSVPLERNAACLVGPLYPSELIIRLLYLPDKAACGPLPMSLGRMYCWSQEMVSSHMSVVLSVVRLTFQKEKIKVVCALITFHISLKFCVSSSSSRPRPSAVAFSSSLFTGCVFSRLFHYHDWGSGSSLPITRPV